MPDTDPRLAALAHELHVRDLLRVCFHQSVPTRDWDCERMAGEILAALPPCDHAAEFDAKQFAAVVVQRDQALDLVSVHAAELERLRGALGDLLWWHEWMQREDRFTADIADTDEEAERRHVLWQTFLDHVATAEWLRAALEPR